MSMTMNNDGNGLRQRHVASSTVPLLATVEKSPGSIVTPVGAHMKSKSERLQEDLERLTLRVGVGFIVFCFSIFVGYIYFSAVVAIIEILLFRELVRARIRAEVEKQTVNATDTHSTISSNETNAVPRSYEQAGTPIAEVIETANGLSANNKTLGSHESAQVGRDKTAIRSEVEALMKLVTPQEADKVDMMMEQFAGREEELLGTLRIMQQRAIAQMTLRTRPGGVPPDGLSRPKMAERAVSAPVMQRNSSDSSGAKRFARNVDDVSVGGFGNENLKAERTAELRRLAKKRDWEGVKAAAARFRAEDRALQESAPPRPQLAPVSSAPNPSSVATMTRQTAPTRPPPQAEMAPNPPRVDHSVKSNDPYAAFEEDEV